MALEKATRVPKMIPIWREPTKPDWPARGAFSSTGKRATIFVAREQVRPLAPVGGDGELLAGLRAFMIATGIGTILIYFPGLFEIDDGISVLSNGNVGAELLH